MDKEELKLKLEDISRELKLENERIVNSKEYKSLSDKKRKIYSKSSDGEGEIRKLRKKIVLKYATKSRRLFGTGFEYVDIKNSVKRGIKKGLEVNNISDANKYDINKIVRLLIDNDLKEIEPQIKKIRDRCLKMQDKMKECNKEEDKLRRKINVLCKKRVRIDNQLNKKGYLKEQRIEKIRKEVGNKVNNHLPEYIDKIKENVERELILDNLK